MKFLKNFFFVIFIRNCCDPVPPPELHEFFVYASDKDGHDLLNSDSGYKEENINIISIPNYVSQSGISFIPPKQGSSNCLKITKNVMNIPNDHYEIIFHWDSPHLTPIDTLRFDVTTEMDLYPMKT